MPADLRPMAIAPRPPGDYAPAAGARAVEAVAAAAAALHEARVLHLSAAGSTGPAPELLGAALPLAAGAGLDVHWSVLFADAAAGSVGTALEHGLRGGESAIDDAQWADWLEGCEALGRSLSGTADVVVLHDAAALGLAAGLDVPVVWRCHLDASRAEADALRRALSLSERCRLVLVPDESFANDFGATVVAAAPGIDPFAARNLELEARLPGRLVRPLGVDLERPFCLQVLELDRWDDPHSVIDAVQLAREEEPELQLVLAALLESADARGWAAAKEVSDYAVGAEGVRLVTSYEGLGGLEVGALELLARVVVEQSLGDSFDLAPCEGLWKRTPVVGAARGALPLVVRDGVDGFLCESTEQTAARLVELVREPGLAAELGRAGRERVRERFLVTAAVERELRVLGDSLAVR